MASFIQGVTSYVPGYQPYQPDFNFLGNILKIKQSQYDQNYKALSERYGDLLNSPMSRTDNIEKRNEFFKLIDNDIKRISGLDLSLEQNVDAANSVFDSFLKNKDLVHDMVYTKTYQKEREKGLAYKGKDGYWDEGLKYLDYRLKEFQEADKATSMTMSPGEYVPRVDIQDMAKSYVMDMFGKSSAFGIEQITYSPDNKYQIKMKNGELLSVPLQTLLSNAFGDDPNVKAMYYTKAYVDRKSHIEQNLDKFNGDANAAEDDYFSKLDNQYKSAIYYNNELQKISEAAKAKKNIIEKQLKKNGSTGSDALSKAYVAAGIDLSTVDKALDHSTEISKIVESIFRPDADREDKRRAVDAFYSNSLMNNEITESAKNIAANTGSIDIKEDEYQLSYYKHSLDVNELITASKLRMKEEAFKSDLASQRDYDKAMLDFTVKTLTGEGSTPGLAGEMAKRGGLASPSNTPVIVKDFAGTTSGQDNREIEDNKQAVQQAAGTFIQSQNDYTLGYTKTLLNITQGKDADEINRAKWTLAALYPEYDMYKNKFIDKNGNETSAESLVNVNTSNSLYKRAKELAEKNKDLDSHNIFLNNQGKNLTSKRDLSLRLYNTSSNFFRDNNKVIKSLKQYSDYKDKLGWENYFTPTNSVRSKEDFAKVYTKRMSEMGYTVNKEDAYDKYDDYSEAYNKIYYSSPKGIKSWYGTPEFQMLGGGKTAGNAFLYSANTKEPGSMGTQGLIGIYNDGLNGGTFTKGNVTEADDLEEDKDSKEALRTYINDLKNGPLSGKDAKAYNAELYYMDLAASDPNYSGAVIKLPQAYIDEYKAKKGQAKTWADRIDPEEGIGVYFKKNTAKNPLTETFKLQPYDILVNHEDQTFEDKDGGRITVKKRNPDGSLEISGNLYHYEGDKLTSKPVYYKYTNDPGGQKLVEGVESLIDKMAKVNQDYVKNNFKLTYDPMQLPDIQKILGEMGGQQSQPSLSDIFRSQLQVNRTLLQNQR